jgi:predicted membrane-bound spermidine synthase
VAGLVYEVLWTRYLGLYVGHGVYAQVLVLGVYLGGMAVGSFVVADVSSRIARPLLWYAAAEALLALFGFVFHPLYVAVTDLSYALIFPAVGSAGLVGSLRWGIAGLLILPQAMILGATFPLMAASLVRADAGRPGRSIARVYLLNTLGGAAGVLLAGFWLIGAFGLPGTGVAAGLINVLAAALAVTADRRLSPTPATTGETTVPAVAEHESRAMGGGGLVPSLLVVSFCTALASFAYEIGWIRMLSLVLGSATHSFELMLSAFILGLAGGSWWVSERVDPARDPIRFLGIVQVAMGAAALASVPLFYWISFDAMAWLMGTLPGRPAGYLLFGGARYALCLLVMLPATVLAGMTVPLLTGTLLRRGQNESAIGRVYGLNTLGSVAGAGLAGLIVLPWLGLKGLILAGAALDGLLGLWLLERSARWRGARPRAAVIAAVASVALFAAVGFGVTLDQIVMEYPRGAGQDPARRLLVAGQAGQPRPHLRNPQPGALRECRPRAAGTRAGRAGAGGLPPCLPPWRGEFPLALARRLVPRADGALGPGTAAARRGPPVRRGVPHGHLSGGGPRRRCAAT